MQFVSLSCVAFAISKDLSLILSEISVPRLIIVSRSNRYVRNSLCYQRI